MRARSQVKRNQTKDLSNTVLENPALISNKCLLNIADEIKYKRGEEEASTQVGSGRVSGCLYHFCDDLRVLRQTRQRCWNLDMSDKSNTVDQTSEGPSTIVCLTDKEFSLRRGADRVVPDHYRVGEQTV